MKKINYLIAPILLLLLLLLTSCSSPKYTTKIIKILPSTKEAKVCMSSCNLKYEMGKEKYITKCKNRVQKCQVLVKQRVTANFSNYGKAYENDLLRYKERLVIYQNEMIRYQENLEDYRYKKDSLQDRYNDKMNEYYEKKDEYKEKQEKYEAYKKEKREYEKYKRVCKKSSNNKFACEKVEEYEDKYRFVFSSHRPKNLHSEPRRPKRLKSLTKPKRLIIPIAPLKPVLSQVIAKEQSECYKDCSYQLENGCFSLCGGSIKHEKICIEDCEEVKK